MIRQNYSNKIAEIKMANGIKKEMLKLYQTGIGLEDIEKIMNKKYSELGEAKVCGIMWDMMHSY